MRRLLAVVVVSLVSACPSSMSPDGGTGGGAATGGGIVSTGGGSVVTGGGSVTAGGSAAGGSATGGGSTAPTITLSPPGPLSTGTAITFTVDLTGSLSSVVGLFIDGSATPVHAFTAPPYVTSVSFAALADGAHTIVAKATLSGSERTSNVVTVNVDRSVPNIVTQWPDAMGTGAGVTPFVHEAWGVTFDKDMVPAAITVRSGGSTLFSGMPTTTDNRTFTFKLTTPPATFPAAVEVDVSALRDAAGNQAANSVRTVGVSAASRMVATFANPMANEASLPGGAVAADGTAYVAFFERRTTMSGPDPTFDRLTVRRLTPGRSEALAALPITSAGSGPVQVVVDSQGRPIVAYDQFSPSAVVKLARLEGAAWNQALATNLSVLDGLTYVRLALSSQGTLVIAGLHRTSNELRVFKLMGQTLTALPAIAVTVPPPAQGSIGPALALHPSDGRIALSWASSMTGNQNYRISFAISDGTAAFVPGTPFTLDTFWSRPFAPTMKWSAAGLFIAFEDHHSVGATTDNNIHVVEADFSAVTPVLRTIGRPLDVDFHAKTYAPSMALDAAGRPVIAWFEDTGLGQQVHVATVDAMGATRLLAGVDLSRQGETAGLNYVTAVGTPYVGVISTRSSIEFARFNGSAALYGRERRPATNTCAFVGGAQASLSATNCFAISDAGLMPSATADLLPFDLISPLWSDGTFKRRWVQLPVGATVGFNATGAFDWPSGTVMVKEFAIELTPGDRTTRRPIETRFLVKPSDGGVWEGYSYQWATDFTDATLRPDTAANIAWTQSTGMYTHVYPSRTNCNRCHTANAGGVLGPIAAQLDRQLDYGGVADHQLRVWNRLGLFGAVTASTSSHVPYVHDASETLENRSRGYLQSNCAHCHRPGGERPNRDFRWGTPLAQAGICANLPDGGTISPEVVPGMPDSSLMVIRMGARPGMPPLATLAVDNDSMRTIRQWIAAMTTCP